MPLPSRWRRRSSVPCLVVFRNNAELLLKPQLRDVVFSLSVLVHFLFKGDEPGGSRIGFANSRGSWTKPLPVHLLRLPGRLNLFRLLLVPQPLRLSFLVLRLWLQLVGLLHRLYQLFGWQRRVPLVGHLLAHPAGWSASAVLCR